MADLYITSFGYGHPEGAPAATITLDLRALFRDPHIDPALRYQNGLDQPVIDKVKSTDGVMQFVVNTAVTLAGLLALGNDITVAVGCVGGRHRSVVIADLIADMVTTLGYGTVVTHRDVRLPVIERGR